METIGRAQSEDSPKHRAGPGDGEWCPADAAIFHHRRRPEADSARTQIDILGAFGGAQNPLLD